MKRNLWLAGPVILFIALCYAYFPESIDDAYITLRYSKNLMLGNGPVFNVGEHVEGFSNPVWMALLSLVGLAGFSMPFAMKVFGIASGIGTILVSAKAARDWFDSTALSFGVALLISVSSFFALWSADGLETVFYSFGIALLLWLTIRDQDNSWIIGSVAAIVALTRPEGAMFGIVAISFMVLRAQIGKAAKVLLPFVAALAGYEVFRLSYFGEWVSNTALAKVHSGRESIDAAWGYIRAFNRDSGYIMGPLSLIGAIVNLRRPGPLLAALFVLAQGVFLAVSGGDFMFGYRFIMPIFPCIAILACGSIVPISRRVWASMPALAMIAAIVGAAQLHSRPPMHVGLDNLRHRASVHFLIANYLKSHTGPMDTVLLSEAGIIPFYIDARVDDYLGLTSAYWYIRNRDRNVEVDHAFIHNPRYVVLSSSQDAVGIVTPRLPEDKTLFESNELKSHYIEVQRFDIQKDASLLNFIYYFYSPSASDIYFTVYKRND